MAILGSSPSLSGLNAAGIGVSANNLGVSLAPGEIVKNSGKFSKPTKIPGKNYSKDEIVIRNSDSGKGELSEENENRKILSEKNCLINAIEKNDFYSDGNQRKTCAYN